jgi:ABC-2 type transport system ATP-binding protein
MIEITRLQKVANSVTVLEVDSLVVNPGEAAAIIDPNSAGITELLALLTGRSRPASGSIRLAWLDPVAERNKLSRKIGVLFPQNGLYENRTARGNLIFHCNVWNLPVQRAEEMLAQVGLADQADTPAKKLPSGLARRLAFGRALLHEPSILLLYQPFAGCDGSSISLLSRLIKEKLEGRGTVLILSPEPTGLASICKQIYALEGGHLIRTGLPQESQASGPLFKVPARLEGIVALVNLPDILYASAEEGQTTLHTVHGPVPNHLTLSELEERLSPNGFFRAHRAYLVNLQWVKAIIPYTRDSFTLVLDNPEKSEIPLSKTAARELKELLGY